MDFEHIALHVPTILLPGQGVDMRKWAVIACDQYTSQPEYWKKVEEYTGDKPSTLNLIFPEVFLDAEDREDRIRRISMSMHRYIEQKILVAALGIDGASSPRASGAPPQERGPARKMLPSRHLRLS